jgi:hypothetical protein
MPWWASSTRPRRCRLDGLQRLDDAELLDDIVDLCPAPDAGGVDQCVAAFAEAERDEDAVAGGAGAVEDDHPFLAEDAVDQRRFAGVGPTDDGDLDAFVGARYCFGASVAAAARAHARSAR